MGLEKAMCWGIWVLRGGVYSNCVGAIRKASIRVVGLRRGVTWLSI